MAIVARQQMGAPRGSRLLCFGVAIAVLAACGGRAPAPPRPDRSITPTTVGVATEFTWGPCASTDLRLEDGTVVNVDDASWGGPDCPAAPSGPLTIIRFGSADDARSFPQSQGTRIENGHRWTEAQGPLVFAGPEDGGWVGLVRWNNRDAWCLFLDQGDGAYREGATLLLNGVVIRHATIFEIPYTTEEAAFPLRRSDELCFNAQGEAIRASVWAPY